MMALFHCWNRRCLRLSFMAALLSESRHGVLRHSGGGTADGQSPLGVNPAMKPPPPEVPAKGVVERPDSSRPAGLTFRPRRTYKGRSEEGTNGPSRVGRPDAPSLPD